MNHLFRLAAIGGLIAAALLIFAVGLAHNDASLMGPVDLILFLLAAAVYLLPTGLALYRDCSAAVWIALVNVLLGWTIVGWFAAIGWAAGGKVRSVRPAVPAPHPQPLAHH